MLPGGIGSQVLSLKRSASAAKFGSSTRDGAGKVYISAEHEKGFVGNSSPGPCTAAQVSSVHRAVDACVGGEVSITIGDVRCPARDMGKQWC